MVLTGVGCRCRRTSWPMKKHSRCLADKVYLPRLSAARDLHLGYATPQVPPLLPRPTATFHERPCRLSRRTACGVPSPMAATARPAYADACFQELVWAPAWPRAQQAPRQADRRLGLGAPEFALAVPQPVAPDVKRNTPYRERAPRIIGTKDQERKLPQ